eukprot:Hpha_TRINITY_DN12684_c1_g1::TRINITY_DN12684_c1_g1_i1::g.49813::m.49813
MKKRIGGKRHKGGSLTKLTKTAQISGRGRGRGSHPADGTGAAVASTTGLEGVLTPVVATVRLFGVGRVRAHLVAELVVVAVGGLHAEVPVPDSVSRAVCRVVEGGHLGTRLPRAINVVKLVLPEKLGTELAAVVLVLLLDPVVPEVDPHSEGQVVVGVRGMVLVPCRLHLLPTVRREPLLVLQIVTCTVLGVVLVNVVGVARGIGVFVVGPHAVLPVPPPDLVEVGVPGVGERRSAVAGAVHEGRPGPLVLLCDTVDGSVRTDHVVPPLGSQLTVDLLPLGGGAPDKHLNPGAPPLRNLGPFRELEVVRVVDETETELGLTVDLVGLPVTVTQGIHTDQTLLAGLPPSLPHVQAASEVAHDTVLLEIEPKPLELLSAVLPTALV